MLQPDLFGPSPFVVRAKAMTHSRAVGQRAGRKAFEAAVAGGFDAFGARAFILGWLRRHGATSGEDLVANAKACGFDPKRAGRDDRAFGAIFQGLQREGLIECLRSDLPRARGHGTSGGRLWAAVP